MFWPLPHARSRPRRLRAANRRSGPPVPRAPRGIMWYRGRPRRWSGPPRSATAWFPVEGLGFNADGVTYQGRPFAQASSAEQLRVSVAPGMALNPSLRVMRIQDGSLLDSESLRLLTELATQHAMQCWIEVVDETGAVGVYIEDGTVAAVNGVPVTETVAV
jgi:hypothetical protein